MISDYGRILSEKHVFATTLVAIALDLFGADGFSWEPDVLRDSISRMTGHTLTPTQNDRLQAGIAMLTTDRMETDWLVLNHLAEILDGEDLTPELSTSAAPEQIAWAIAEYQLLTGQEFDGAPEIWAYIGRALYEHGLHTAPESLKAAQMPQTDTTGMESDPQMYQSFAKREIENREMIDRHVSTRTRELVKQLLHTPLRNADREALKQLQAHVQ